MDGLPFFEYLREYQSDLGFETYRHAVLSIQVLLVAAAIGVGLAVSVYRSRWARTLLVSVAVVAFTIPSLALLGVLQPLLGLGLQTVFPVLVLYALLPIIRNSIVGLRGVDPTLLDAATGLGMSRSRILLRIELPLAWPVMLTGLRVSAQMTLGIAAIGAFFAGPGLGTYIFHALSAVGSVNTFNEALAATLLVTTLALLFDLAFVLIRRLTTPRGIRV